MIRRDIGLVGLCAALVQEWPLTAVIITVWGMRNLGSRGMEQRRRQQIKLEEKARAKHAKNEGNLGCTSRKSTHLTSQGIFLGRQFLTYSIQRTLGNVMSVLKHMCRFAHWFWGFNSGL